MHTATSSGHIKEGNGHTRPSWQAESGTLQCTSAHMGDAFWCQEASKKKIPEKISALDAKLVFNGIRK